jgi:ketosteroid isomerase-like protein
MRQLPRALALALALIAASSSAFGQKADNKSAKSGGVEEAVKQLERDWANAAKSYDVATLNRIVADDWVGTDETGKRTTKAQMIANTNSHKGTLGSFTFDDMTVRVYGNTAIVTGGDTETSTFDGKDTSGHYFWTDVFVKQKDGSWKAVASHTSKAPAS